MAQLQKREKIMVSVTGGVLLAFLFYQFVLTKPSEQTVQAKRPKPVPGSVQLPAGKTAAAAKSTKASVGTPKIDGWGRDPFSEAYRLAVFDTSKVDSAAQLVLKGITWNGKLAYALINDAILRKGENYRDIRILDIKKESVICRRGNSTITLFLDDEK